MSKIEEILARGERPPYNRPPFDNERPSGHTAVLVKEMGVDEPMSYKELVLIKHAIKSGEISEEDAPLDYIATQTARRSGWRDNRTSQTNGLSRENAADLDEFYARRLATAYAKHEGLAADDPQALAWAEEAIERLWDKNTAFNIEQEEGRER